MHMTYYFKIYKQNYRKIIQKAKGYNYLNLNKLIFHTQKQKTLTFNQEIKIQHKKLW